MTTTDFYPPREIEQNLPALEVMDCGIAVGRTPEVLPITEEEEEYFERLTRLAGMTS